MDHLEYLFAGFAVFWAGLFVYLLWLQARLRAVSRELRQLEERLADRSAGGSADVRLADVRRPEVTLRDVAPQRTTE
ncbi:MAG: CcmD family protein [Dehalococcoidia bacterium]